MIEDCVNRAAKCFTVHARDSSLDFEACNDRVNFCTGGAAVKMLDLETHRYRPSNLQDLYNLARLCGTLDNIQWFTRPVVATYVQAHDALASCATRIAAMDDSNRRNKVVKLAWKFQTQTELRPLDLMESEEPGEYLCPQHSMRLRTQGRLRGLCDMERTGEIG